MALALFTNYDFRLPLALTLPLAFHTTAVVGLNEDLNLPAWKFSRKDNVILNNPSKVTLTQLAGINETEDSAYKSLTGNVKLGLKC